MSVYIRVLSIRYIGVLGYMVAGRVIAGRYYGSIDAAGGIHCGQILGDVYDYGINFMCGQNNY